MVTSAEPVDFQQLLKEVENYSFGSTNLSDYLAKLRDSNQAILNCFSFISYETELNQPGQPTTVSMSFERNSDYETSESMDFETTNQPDKLTSNINQPTTSGSNTKISNLSKNESLLVGDDDIGDYETNKIDTSSSTDPHPHHQFSKKGKTKVAQSHHFRTVRTLSKCKECDVMNFNFQGLECVQVSEMRLFFFDFSIDD